MPDSFPEELLETLLAISLTGVIVLSPVYSPAGALEDFAIEYLNPAGQRMTGLDEQPGGTLLTRFPSSVATGIFDYYQRVYEVGATGIFQVNYQADDLDNYFHVAARRSGELLVVSFTDTSDQNRSAVEEALRQSQAAEKAARAEAELQRERFYDLLMQLPAHVAVHEGPDQVFTLINPYYQRLAPGRELLGTPIREAWPELVSQGILDVLDRVYHTGEPFVGAELPLQVDFTRTGHPQQVYYNAFFLPLRDAQGLLAGVLDFSYDVTEQVEARRQLQQLNQELAASNEELRTSNEELGSGKDQTGLERL
jgi:PAS domain-containing protein